jgi:hypothetical protein
MGNLQFFCSLQVQPPRQNINFFSSDICVVPDASERRRSMVKCLTSVGKRPQPDWKMLA